MNELLDDLLVGYRVLKISGVSGGDISKAYRIDTSDGPVFAKCHNCPKPDMFAREAAGLRALRAAVGPDLGVPEVLAESDHGLVLEWIESGMRNQRSESALGIGLAGLHRSSGPVFGGIDDSLAGYLGSAEVDLTPTTDWVEFFFQRRITKLAMTAVELNRLDPVALRLIDRLEPQAADLCGPAEPPALVHGDLWAGNRMVDTHGRNWLIDPSAHWGHREYDLAMMQLFGGFGAEAFRAYHEAFPLAEGWTRRVKWYQLPPLLVHAILFGGGYGTSVMSVLRHYSR